MARTLLTATALTSAGVDPADVDSAATLGDGNAFAWARHRLLYVLNGDSTPLTVTIPTPGTVGSAALAIAEVTVVVPAGEYRLAGPFGREVVQSGGQVHVNYSGADAAVQVAVLDAAPAA